MGLTVYLKVDDKFIEFPSKKYPDHLFKVGYFRSSYNASGINYVLESRGLPTLWDVFDAKPGEFVPDWEKSLERANCLLTDLKHSFEELPYTVLSIIYGPWDSVVTDPNRVLTVFKQQKEMKPFDQFFNRTGFFSLNEPIQVHAIIPGDRTVYVVTPITQEQIDYYVQALEIVVETIEYVLSEETPAPSLHKLCWSS